jgi:hypothetical protein
VLDIDPYKRDWSKYKRGGMMTDEEAAQAAVTHLTLDAEVSCSPVQLFREFPCVT